MFETKEKFLSELKPGMVFYFKDLEVSEHIPHYFVIINKDIENSPVLVLPVATSQIEKRKNYYKSCKFNEKCLIIVEPEEVNNILSKTSAFDCNQVKNKSVFDLYELCIKGKARYNGILPEEIVNKLRNGVIFSNQVEKRIKDLI